MVGLLVTYMEVTAPQGAALAAPRPDATVQREAPSLADYLAAYRDIGAPVQWDSRLRIPESKVAAWLSAPTSDVYLLRLAGEIAGLCEFDSTQGNEVELVHFGLLPSTQGGGLGSWLLDHALRDCWARRNPARIWLHTDTNDNPKAVGVYARAGFTPYLSRVEQFDD